MDPHVAPRVRQASVGLTIIEITVVLAILAILLMLSVPRYLAFRKDALVAEADENLGELKTLAWGYYLQHSTWAGITSTNFASAFNFHPPDDLVGCWDYDLAADGTATQIQLRATGDGTPVKCLLVSGTTVTLTLNGDGSSVRTRLFP